VLRTLPLSCYASLVDDSVTDPRLDKLKGRSGRSTASRFSGQAAANQMAEKHVLLASYKGKHSATGKKINDLKHILPA